MVSENSTNPFFKSLVDATIDAFGQKVQSIVLFGGIVRDGVFYTGWSDLDLIIIFKGMPDGTIAKCKKFPEITFEEQSLRVDPIFVFNDEITTQPLSNFFLNGPAINALIIERKVGLPIFGKIPQLRTTPHQERVAAILYITDIRYQLRNFIWDFSIQDCPNLDYAIPRVSRWCFSTIRASLRLFEIYSHPYEESIFHLETLFPSKDFSLLHRIASLRKNFIPSDADRTLVEDTYLFVEDFIPFVLSKLNFTEIFNVG